MVYTKGVHLAQICVCEECVSLTLAVREGCVTDLLFCAGAMFSVQRHRRVHGEPVAIVATAAGDAADAREGLVRERTRVLQPRADGGGLRHTRERTKAHERRMCCTAARVFGSVGRVAYAGAEVVIGAQARALPARHVLREINGAAAGR